METMPVCNNFVRQRLMLEELYPEPTTFGDCDCTSYSYLCLSLVLLSFGTFVTVASLSGGNGERNDFIFSNMGHMWLIGPICISSGTMIAIKIVLYLRRKSVIQMALRHGALVSGWLEWLEEHVERMGSVVRNPPAYDLLMAASSGGFEAPPPSYEDAVLLMNNEKSAAVVNNRDNLASCCSKDRIGNTENGCSDRTDAINGKHNCSRSVCNTESCSNNYEENNGICIDSEGNCGDATCISDEGNSCQGICIDAKKCVDEATLNNEKCRVGTCVNVENCYGNGICTCIEDCLTDGGYLDAESTCNTEVCRTGTDTTFSTDSGHEQPKQKT